MVKWHQQIPSMDEAHHILELLPLMLSAPLVLGAILLYFAIRQAPEGSEDDSGFHTR